MADVQIAVIDPEDTQLALAAPAEAVVNVAVPGVQGPIGLTGSVTIAQAGTAAEPGIRFESDTNTGIYSPGADQLAVSTGGTGRLFIDGSGRVGIGTSSPGAKLHVVGSAGTNFGVSDGSAYGLRIDNGIAYGLTGSTIHGVDQTFFGSYQPLTLNGSQLGFAIGGTERLRIDSSGNVGIGTSSPAARLHVISSEAQIESQTTSDGFLRFTNTSGSMSIGMSGAPTNALLIADRTNNQVAYTYNGGASGSHIWATNNIERLRIDSSGRLLVGTSSARVNFFNSTLGAQLQIEGTGFSNTAISSVRSSNDQFASAFIFGKNRGSVGANTIVQNNDELGALVFSGNDGSEFVNGASIGAFVDGTPGSNDMPGRLVFSTTSDGAASPTERLRIDSSGRVGIGTSSPTFKLMVVAPAGAQSIFLAGQTGVSNGYEITSTGSALTHVWSTAGGEKLRLTDGGNLGIGTSSPGVNLDIASTTPTVRVNATGGGTPSLSLFSNGVYDWLVQGGTALKIVQDTTERLRIDSSGNVGIGTSSPAQKLDVAGGVTSTGLNVTGLGGFFNAANKFGVDNNVGATRMYSSGPDASTRGSYDFRATDSVGTLDTSRMVIDSSGRVGIGTTAPTTLLDVNADTVRVRTARTPASATATGATGEICWDANYIYVCTATNTWRRTAISSW